MTMTLKQIILSNRALDEDINYVVSLLERLYEKDSKQDSNQSETQACTETTST